MYIYSKVDFPLGKAELVVSNRYERQENAKNVKQNYRLSFHLLFLKTVVLGGVLSGMEMV